MTAVIGIRDLVRNSSILDDYDYVDIEDKKTHKYKGLFISPKYANEFKSYLENKIAQEKQDKLDRIKKYAGIGKIDERFNTLTSEQVKEKIAKEKSE